MNKLLRTAVIATVASGGLALAAAPAQADTAGTQTVTGWTVSQCNDAGHVVAQDLINRGYNVMFVGCFSSFPSLPGYTGTVYYRTGY